MAEENVPRSKGVVQRFNNQKGYGFIKLDEGDDDLFVHQTDIKLDGYRTLRAGQEVEFNIVLDKDKYKAADVTAPGGGPVDTAPRRSISRNSRGRGTSERRNGDNGYVERRSNGNGGGGGGGRGCYSCGELGHRAQDCENEVICYNCRGVGHLARECPSEARGGGRVEKTCYTCKQPGHLVRDCTSGGGEGEYQERVCYNCQQPGHLKRNCPSQGDGAGGGGGDSGKVGGGKSGECYNCGKFGHFSRDCKKHPRPRA